MRTQHILSIQPKMQHMSGISAHVGHKRRALGVVVDVVIIRRVARRAGERGSLFAAYPVNE